MLTKSIAISTLLHLIIGVFVVYSVETLSTSPQAKVMPITIVALASTPKTEPRPPKPVQKKEIQKKLLKPKPKVKKPKPKPVVKPVEKPIVKKIEESPKPVAKKIQSSTAVKAEPVVKPESEPVENASESIEPVVVEQTSEPEISSSERKNIKNDYLRSIYQSIATLKVYPRNARKLRQSGTVQVTFTVLADGTITNILLSDTSGFRILDNAAKQILETLAKVAAIPKELNEESMTIALPLEYKLEF